MRLIEFKQKEMSKVSVGLGLDGYLLDLSMLDEFYNISNINDLIVKFDSYKSRLNDLINNHPKDIIKSYEEIDFLPPVSGLNKIICVGHNYKKLSKGEDFKKAEYPTLFPRFISSIVGHQEKILKPKISDECDYEGELVVVIAKKSKNIKQSEVEDVIFGYSIFNDVTIRDYQRKSSQFFSGKNFDKSGSFGPWICTKDEVPSCAEGLKIQTFINEELLQNDLTSNMIFPITELVSLVSEVMELNPGDLIVTGTPSGVGSSYIPKIYLKPGDKCEVKIEKIGSLINIVE